MLILLKTLLYLILFSNLVNYIIDSIREQEELSSELPIKTKEDSKVKKDKPTNQ